MRKYIGIFLICLICVLTFSSCKNKNNTETNTFVVKVETDSMMPMEGYSLPQVYDNYKIKSFKKDNKLKISKDTSEISIGDVVYYCYNDYYWSYRVVEINDNYYITMGDRNTSQYGEYSSLDSLTQYNLYVSGCVHYVQKSIVEGVVIAII